MFAGRRKTKAVAVTNANKMKMKQETHEENSSYDSPQRKGSKVEFQGKLSHASVISSSSKITRFFQPQVPTSPLQDTKIAPTNSVPVIGRTSPRRHASTMSVLQQANGEIFAYIIIKYVMLQMSMAIESGVLKVCLFFFLQCSRYY